MTTSVTTLQIFIENKQTLKAIKLHLKCNMYGVYLFNMFTKFMLIQILETLMVNKLL